MKITEYRVEDVMNLVRRPVQVSMDGTYKQIGLRSFGKGVFHKQPVSGEEIANKKVYYIEPGDLIFSNVFAWEGAVALACESESGMIGSHRFMTYLINEDIADSRYLLRYFYGGPGLRVIREASPGSAGRNRTLGIKNFERQLIELPDLSEQRRIADRLDESMQKVIHISTLRNRATTIAEQHRDAIFRSIPERAPLAAVLHQRNDLVDVQPSKSYPTAGILNRGRGLFRRPPISGDETKYTRYNTLHVGQFVYSKLFGWEGSLAVVQPDFEGIYVSHEFPTFDINSASADIEYMTHLARWSGLHDALKDQGTGMGSRRQRVNIDRLLATEVPMPNDLTEQRRIARELSLAYQTMRSGVEQSEHLVVLKKSLLNAAFAGQL